MRVRAGAAELRSTVPDDVPVIGAAELSGLLIVVPLGDVVAPLLGDVMLPLLGDVLIDSVDDGAVVLLFMEPAAPAEPAAPVAPAAPAAPAADESVVVEPAAPPVTELRSVVSRASGSLVVDAAPAGDVVVEGDVVVAGGCELPVDGSEGDVVGAPMVPGPLGDVVGWPPVVGVEPVPVPVPGVV
jgi:hypothetical protein